MRDEGRRGRERKRGAGKREREIFNVSWLNCWTLKKNSGNQPKKNDMLYKSVIILMMVSFTSATMVRIKYLTKFFLKINVGMK